MGLFCDYTMHIFVGKKFMGAQIYGEILKTRTACYSAGLGLVQRPMISLIGWLQWFFFKFKRLNMTF